LVANAYMTLILAAAYPTIKLVTVKVLRSIPQQMSQANFFVIDRPWVDATNQKKPEDWTRAKQLEAATNQPKRHPGGQRQLRPY
jgi:hypothetical protein